MHIDTNLEFYHANTRREKAGAAKRGPLAMDLKFKGKRPISELAGLFSSPAAFEMIARLYNQDGTLITPDVASIELAQEGTGVHVQLCSSRDDTVKAEFTKGTTLDQLALVPLAGRVAEIKCRLIVHPTKEQDGELGEMLEDTVTLKIEMAQLEMPLASADAAAATPDANEATEPEPELPQWELPPGAPPMAEPHFLGKDAAGQRIYRRGDGALLVAVREGAVEELVEVPEVDLVDPARKLVDTRSKRERMAAETADAL